MGGVGWDRLKTRPYRGSEGKAPTAQCLQMSVWDNSKAEAVWLEDVCRLSGEKSELLPLSML